MAFRCNSRDRLNFKSSEAGMKTVEYQFNFSEDDSVSISYDIDKNYSDFTHVSPNDIPHWVELSYHQCGNCSLDKKRHLFCPVALNLLEVVQKFESKMSYTEVSVNVLTEERTYCKVIPLQKAISSLMGLIMVYSGCPVMEKLKPMGYFHLPFSSIDETVYRVLSMYLLGQYARMKNGKEPDWELEYLKDMYREINVVNSAFSNRIRSISEGDSSVNGLIILSNFAQFVSFSIDEDMFDSIEALFESYYR